MAGSCHGGNSNGLGQMTPQGGPAPETERCWPTESPGWSAPQRTEALSPQHPLGRFPTQPVNSSKLHIRTRLPSSLQAHLVAGEDLLLADLRHRLCLCPAVRKCVSQRTQGEAGQDRSEGFSKRNVSGRRQLLPEALPYEAFILNSSWAAPTGLLFPPAGPVDSDVYGWPGLLKANLSQASAR